MMIKIYLSLSLKRLLFRRGTNIKLLELLEVYMRFNRDTDNCV